LFCWLIGVSFVPKNSVASTSPVEVEVAVGVEVGSMGVEVAVSVEVGEVGVDAGIVAGAGIVVVGDGVEAHATSIDITAIVNKIRHSLPIFIIELFI
jgi:hypothetical protein